MRITQYEKDRQKAQEWAEQCWPIDGELSRRVHHELMRQAFMQGYEHRLKVSERSKPAAKTKIHDPLFDRMEAICARRYKDGDQVHFRTLGMRDEYGEFIVRINRMFLHKAPALRDAIEFAVKEWENIDDINDQLEP